MKAYWHTLALTKVLSRRKMCGGFDHEGKSVGVMNMKFFLVWEHCGGFDHEGKSVGVVNMKFFW